MIVRLATAEDAESISKLATEFHDYLHRLGDRTDLHFTASTYLRDGFGEKPAFIALAAESNHAVIGYLILHFGYDTDRSRREAYVDDVYVQESWRGQGVGKALMMRAGETARSHGAEALWWGVYELNHPALRFYEKLGARPVRGIRFMSIDTDQLLGTG